MTPSPSPVETGSAVEVRPCPFCRSLNIGWKMLHGHTRAASYCEECGAQGPSVPFLMVKEPIDQTIAPARAAWNERAALSSTPDPVQTTTPTDAEGESDERTPAQFFFEVGYGACWAESYVRTDGKPPFTLTDATVERAWAIAGEAHDDPAEFDAYLARANAGSKEPTASTPNMIDGAAREDPDAVTGCADDFMPGSADQWRNFLAAPDTPAAAVRVQDAVAESEGTSLGEILCHCSEDDGMPDVGVSLGLGEGAMLWLGELLNRDGADIGFIFHGPNGERIVGPLWPSCEWQEAADILRHHVAPILSRAAALKSESREHSGMTREGEVSDSDLLDALRDECWDLRCFDRPTGGGDADVGWRVIGHWQAEPHERTIAEAYDNDPRAAIRAALTTQPGEG